LSDNLAPIGYYVLYIGLLPVLLVIWGVLLHYFGMYKKVGLVQVPDALFIIIKATLVGFVLFGSYVFMLKMQEDISRLFIGLTFISSAVLLSLEKIALVQIFKILSKRDTSFKSALIAFRRIIVVGTNTRAKNFIKLINSHPNWGIKIASVVDIESNKKGYICEGHEVMGSLEHIPEIISKDIIDEIVFIVPRRWLNKIEDAILFCESAGLKVNIAVNLFELKFLKAKQTDLKGFPLLAFERESANFSLLFVKRIFDFFVSAIGLCVLAPVLLITVILVKLTSGGPIFYKQMRCGLYGRQFIFYKFRTMVVDAEARLKDILQYNEMHGPVFKMTNDPRVTKIGKWLRRFSIDEIPQLWNVVKGDMSLVGPRPPLPQEVEKYDLWQRRRLSMRPGITCVWQMSGRNRIDDFKEWIRLDLEYIDNWSLWLDFKILFKTIPVVLLGTGAK
jgi:exopolysaccharide biosynthesis polyprenyl glycosylphosphotransferase